MPSGKSVKPAAGAASQPPAVVYLVAGTPRTGTTLLCEALDAAGAGRPSEWFSRAELPSLTDTGGLGAEAACRGYLLDRLRQTCRNNVSGFKLHWHQLEQLTRAGTGAVVDELLSGRLVAARVHAVLVTRSPVDVQAVSVLRAYASGVFAVDDAGPNTVLRYDDAFWGPPGVAAAARERLKVGDVYDFADLATISEAIERANHQWWHYLRRLGVSIRHVSYDDLSADLVGTTNAVLADLRVPDRLAADYRPSLVVQRDAATVRLVSRFRADATRDGSTSR